MSEQTKTIAKTDQVDPILPPPRAGAATVPALSRHAATPAPEPVTSSTAETLMDLLGQHSERDLLLMLTSQLLATQAEVRILQATVNTLLIELCHRQPEKLTQNLNRMSAQRQQELLTDFQKQSDAFGRHSRGEVARSAKR